MHKVLERQLKKAFGSLEAVPANLAEFVKLVDDAYTHYDEDRVLVERSLEISSKELLAQASALKATLNSIVNGILVVDGSGKVVMYNERLLTMWGVTKEVLANEREMRMQAVIDKVKDPEGFAQRVHQIYDDPTAETSDVIELKDGRVFQRDSRPQYSGSEVTGRVWSFLDVTEKRQSESKELERLHDLERMNKLMIDRELKMIELKQELDRLKAGSH